MMKKMLIGVFILLIASITLVSTLVSAFTASVGNPKMVLYENITKGQVLDIKNDVQVINDNPSDIKIIITPIGAWKNRTDIIDSNFILTKGTTKDVLYSLRIEKAGYYDGDMLVNFIDIDTNASLSITQKVIVIVQDENGKVPDEIKDNGEKITNTPYLLIGVVIAIILIILLWILIKSVMKKKSKK